MCFGVMLYNCIEVSQRKPPHDTCQECITGCLYTTSTSPLSPETFLSILGNRKRSSPELILCIWQSLGKLWHNASLFTLTRKFRVKPEAASSNVQGMMEHILTLFLALFFYPHSLFAFIWSSICFLPLHEFLEVAANQFWKGYGSG